jgi:hypothetical protein
VVPPETGRLTAIVHVTARFDALGTVRVDRCRDLAA